MAQVKFSLTKREPQAAHSLQAHTEADLSTTELDALVQELKANGNPAVGDFAAIYVAPEDYTLQVNGEKIQLKPQFFPPAYGYIIDKLMAELK